MKRVVSGLVLLSFLVLFGTIVGAVGTPNNTMVQGMQAGYGSAKPPWLSAGWQLPVLVNEPLVEVNWNAELQPMLAKSWEMLDGGQTWIFHLRQGVTWHDGQPFTAKDVVFTYNMYANPKTAATRAYLLQDIVGYDAVQAGTSTKLAGVTALDKYTVQVKLTKAFPLWVKLKQILVPIFPEHILGNVAPEKIKFDSSYWDQNRVGTGPYKWLKYVPDQYVELEANTNYYLGAPKIKYMIFRFYKDPASMVAALRNGEIDMTPFTSQIVSIDDIASLDSLPNIKVLPWNFGGPNYIKLNLKKFPWSDVRVRQALRYAIDVNTICKTIWKGYAKPAYSIFAQSWANPDNLNTYPYDPNKAKQLLKAAGFDFSKTYEFFYYYTDAFSKRLILAIQQYLAQVGIKIEPRKVDVPWLNANVYGGGNWDFGYVGFASGLDPSGADVILRSDSVYSGGYNNPQVDGLLNKGLSYASTAQRTPIYQQVARIINEELPGVWLWFPPRPIGFNLRVVGPYEYYAKEGIRFGEAMTYLAPQTWYIKQ